MSGCTNPALKASDVDVALTSAYHLCVALRVLLFNPEQDMDREERRAACEVAIQAAHLLAQARDDFDVIQHFGRIVPRAGGCA